MKNIIEPLQNLDYDDVFESIQNDAQQRGLSDDQIWKIWKAGISTQVSKGTRLMCWLGFHVAENIVDICHCRCIHCGFEWEENPYLSY